MRKIGAQSPRNRRLHARGGRSRLRPDPCSWGRTRYLYNRSPRTAGTPGTGTPDR